MSTINETFEEAEQEIHDLYNSNPHWVEVLKSVHNLITLLNGNQVWSLPVKEFQYYSADELTRIWGKLAIYQYNLIEYELEAFKNSKKAELIIDAKRYAMRNTVVAGTEKKPSETEIKLKVDSLMVKYEFIKELHEAELNKLTALKFSINTIINRIESRIKYLLSDVNPKFKND